MASRAAPRKGVVRHAAVDHGSGFRQVLEYPAPLPLFLFRSVIVTRSVERLRITSLALGMLLVALGPDVRVVAGVQAEARKESEKPERGRLTGLVYDSIRSKPLPGAQVVLLGTPFRGLTNGEGAFLIPNLPPGRYRAAFVHERLDSLTFVPQPREIEIGVGLTRVTLAIPLAPPIRSAQHEARKVATALNDMGVEVDTRVQTLIDEAVGIPVPGKIVGIVRDEATSRRISDASIALQGTKFRAMTDGQGRFVFVGVPPGNYVLAAEMLGYAARFETFRMVPGRGFDVDLSLSTQPIALEPLKVEARSLSLERTGFYDRRLDPLLQGSFLTRGEIERRAAESLGDLFREIPGARVDRLGMGNARVRFLRAVSGGTAGQGCEPGVWVDGIRSRDPWNDVPPMTIEALEVYVGAIGPVQYNHSCGVVLVWTRRPV